MPSVSAYSSSVGTQNNTETGTATWSNTSNVVGVMNTGVAHSGTNSANSVVGSVASVSLDFTFDPSVPVGATITGIAIAVSVAYSAISGGVSFDGSQLSLGGTYENATQNAFGGITGGTTMNTYNTGSSTDLWNFSSGSLTPANLNSCIWSVWFIGSHSGNTAYVGGAQITVTYTLPSVSGLMPLFGGTTPLNNLATGKPAQVV
jgi:hypothetical protein